MLVVTSNKSNQLLMVSYVGHVTLPELSGGRPQVETLIGELSPGFRVISDFTHMEKMDADCREEIGAVMELFEKQGVGRIARIMPDASKDLGMNILTHFHYKNPPQIFACQTMAEAVQALAL